MFDREAVCTFLAREADPGQGGQLESTPLLWTLRKRLAAGAYAGHPLYYYVDDSPGTILGHDVAEFGGLWLVVKPSGQAA